MPSYEVIWRIDIEADSPEQAAFAAVAVQRCPDSTAVVFEITDTETCLKATVDLERED